MRCLRSRNAAPCIHSKLRDFLVFTLLLSQMGFEGAGLLHGEDNRRTAPGCQVRLITCLHPGLDNVFDQLARLTNALLAKRAL